jgi:hypothetical protein
MRFPLIGLKIDPFSWGIYAYLLKGPIFTDEWETHRSSSYL